MLLDGPALATALRRDGQTIRAWAASGRLTRRGTDARGRTLYDLDEALGVSERAQRRTRRSLSTLSGSNTAVPGPSRVAPPGAGA
jgi:hypothetical protein